jgi:ferrochelatase
MGGARSKSELKEFLKNMFFDKRIIRSPLRFILSPLIVFFRLNEAWKNYELIGGSKIYEHTQNLVDKLNESSNGKYDLFFAMRYTSPRICDILDGKNYDEILLFPMYPHFSSTTTLSSFDDADKFFKNKNTKVYKIEHFFEDEEFNKTIVSSIKRYYQEGSHLIFSAHSLPLSIAKNDKYEEHIRSHIEILKHMLKNEGLKFDGIHLAFQSKLGPVKWLEPSIDKVLRSIAPNPVLIYPISFTIDNSETDYELAIYYKNAAKEFGITSYNVCETQNNGEEFVKMMNNKILEVFINKVGLSPTLRWVLKIKE